MSKIEEARALLKELNVPSKQQADLCCYVLLAMADIKEDDNWAKATNKWIRIHDVLTFTKDNYNVAYAENSRETFRKQAMHHFRNAAFIEDNGKATNSPNYRYRLTEEMLDLIKSYGTDTWAYKKEKFLAAHESLISMYESKRSMLKMPVNINGNGSPELQVIMEGELVKHAWAADLNGDNKREICVVMKEENGELADISILRIKSRPVMCLALHSP